MSGKEFALFFMVATAAGLLGGTVSSLFLASESVLAQDTAKSATIIEAGEFRLVDKDGKTRAHLFMPFEEGVALFLNDGNEKIRARIAVVGSEGMIVLHNRDGRLTWSAP